jgi:hypothetical protein
MKAIPLFKLAGQYDEMDVLARAQFLEGYLHAIPFHYIKGALGKSQLIMSIVKMLHEIGGTPSPEWFSKLDTGLYKATYRAVNRAISSQRGERAMEAVDILQTMMGVSGWEGESGKSPFWMAGKHVSTTSPEAFTSGEMLPIGASGLTVRLAQRRALDTIRGEADRAKKRHEHHEDIIDETISGESAQEDWGQIIDAVFANPDHPISKKFFGWLEANISNVMRRGEGARLMSGYLGLLRSGTVSSDVEAAAALGSSSAALSNTKKVFMDSMAGYMSSDPRVQLEVQDMFSDAKFLQDLLRGNIQGGRVGSLAKKVATRFLARRASQTTLAINLDYGGNVKEVYPDPYNQTYDSHIIDSRQPKTVQRFALEALRLFVKENPNYRGMSFGDVAKFLGDYVSQKTGGKWSYVRWNSKSYPD